MRPDYQLISGFWESHHLNSVVFHILRKEASGLSSLLRNQVHYKDNQSLNQQEEVHLRAVILFFVSLCTVFTKLFRWVLIIIFFEILIPPEPFMRDAPHFFYRKYNKNLL